MVGALVGADVVLLSAWIFLDPVQCLQNLNAELKVRRGREGSGRKRSGVFLSTFGITIQEGGQYQTAEAQVRGGGEEGWF